MSVAQSDSTVKNKPAKRYGWSAFVTACARFWRATLLFVVVAIVNAAIQALLLLPKPVPGVNSISFLLLAILSYIVLVLSLALITAAALQVVTGKAKLAGTFAAIKPHLGRFVLWVFVWTIVCTIGLMLYAIPGIIGLLITPYVALAAADGARNPFGANFRAIGSRFGRYLITLVISGFWLVVLYVISGMSSFILDGSTAAFVFWLIAGILGAWMITAWALIYRSTTVGAPTTEAATDADATG